jgi:hypothetical protein
MNRVSLRLASLWPALMLAAACSDRTPLLGTGEGPAPVAVRLDCSASVRERTMTCSAPARPGGPAGDLLVGAPYAKLASANVSFDAAAGTLGADVTVQNLMQQAIGTADGTSPDPEGVRVFFASGPTATAGSGQVTLANADGTGAFTAAAQPFFRYPGVLAPQRVSQPKRWVFALEAGVTAFSFSVMVSAPIQNTGRWLDVAADSPVVAPGDTLHLSATYRRASGAMELGGPVAWSSSAPAIVQVDANGVVTALLPGSAVVTATGDGMSGSTTVFVPDATAADADAPTVGEVALDRSIVDLTDRLTLGFSEVKLTARVRDRGVGLGSFSASFQAPGGSHVSVGCAENDWRGHSHDRVWTCRGLIPANGPPGQWTVDHMIAMDLLGNPVRLDHAQIAAAGFPSSFTVKGGMTDTDPPAVTVDSITPDSLDVGATREVSIYIHVVDAGVGIGNDVGAALRDPGNGTTVGCFDSFRASGSEHDGVYRCRVFLPAQATPGDWLIDYATAVDLQANQRTIHTADIQAAGSPDRVKVTGGTADTTPPMIGALTVTTDTVNIGSPDLLARIQVALNDPGSGMASLNINVHGPDGSDRGCTYTSPPEGIVDRNGTWTCLVQMTGAALGTWSVTSVVAADNHANVASLAAPGFPAGSETTFVVVNKPIVVIVP